MTRSNTGQPVMKGNLDGLVASCGGDGPEAQTAALPNVPRGSAKMVVLTTDAPPNGVGKDGNGFTGLPGSSDESIGASSNVFCPANDPLQPAAQMAERVSRGSEVAGCQDMS